MPIAQPLVAPDIRQTEDKELLRLAFRATLWGEEAPENARRLEQIEQEALYRSQYNPRLFELVRNSMESGRLAAKLCASYQKKLQEEGNSLKVQAWRERKTSGQHFSVAYALDQELNKWEAHQKTGAPTPRNEVQQKKPRMLPTLAPIKLSAQGLHPNSLRQLTPQPLWDILIDEGGLDFTENSLEIPSQRDSEIGRFVALALPNGWDGVDLPPLTGQHATETSFTLLQQQLYSLLQQPVGIFGFKANDPDLNSRSYWMAHIFQLMRWVLLLLPMAASAPVRVRFLIEQHGDYTPNSDLTALREVLENEIKGLDPVRFSHLQLELAILDKNGHPGLPYADLLCNLWGSPTVHKNQLLERTHLLGSCLLQPEGMNTLERLYLSLNSQRQLLPAQWYLACSQASSEGEHALLVDFLARWGQKVRENPNLWQGYLQEVSYRLSTKNYRLHELGAALEWLQSYAPETEKLPPVLELQLRASRLSLANHQGQSRPEDLLRTFSLMQQLEEENAPLACETLLRLAISGTNAFEFFSQAQTLLEDWLQKPIATPGLLNHGKLHSTLGQLLAFQGHPEQAISCFDRALATFARLSDAQQATKEQQQTLSYRLCALMDCEDLAHSTLLQEALGEYLKRVTGEAELTAQIKALAVSGTSLAYVYAHHLLLRCLITWPELLAPVCKLYLQERPRWQSGEVHPWPLIQAYRGWLLQLEGETELAEGYFYEAISLCEADDKGPTLHWMGAVLRQVASQLLQKPVGEGTADLAALRLALPQAPHQLLAEAGEAPLDLLKRALPFNFH